MEQDNNRWKKIIDYRPLFFTDRSPRVRSSVGLITIVLAAFAVGYLAWAKVYNESWPFDDTFYPYPENKNNAPQPPLNLRGGEGELKDWQTYRNEEYGFEIRYPRELVFSSIFEPEIDMPSDNFIKKGGSLHAWINFPKKEEYIGTHFVQAFVTVSTNSSLTEGECQAFMSLGVSHPGGEFGRRIVNGIKFMEASAAEAFWERGIPDISNETKVYHAFRSNVCYEVDLHYAGIDYQYEYQDLKSFPDDVLPLLDQILSTFRFIE